MRASFAEALTSSALKICLHHLIPHRLARTLLTDAGNSRAVEVDENDAVVWQYFTNTDALSVAAPLPTTGFRSLEAAQSETTWASAQRPHRKASTPRMTPRR